MRLSATSGGTCLQWSCRNKLSPSRSATLWFYISWRLRPAADCVSSPAEWDSPLYSTHLHTHTHTHTPVRSYRQKLRHWFKGTVQHFAVSPLQFSYELKSTAWIFNMLLQTSLFNDGNRFFVVHHINSEMQKHSCLIFKLNIKAEKSRHTRTMQSNKQRA